MSSKARIVFLIRVPEDRWDEFLQAYQQVRYEVANGVPGHIVDQVCQSPADPEQWLITSEWETLADFKAWETSPDHRILIHSMRECMTEARSLQFEVQVQTSRLDDPARTDSIRQTQGV